MLKRSKIAQIYKQQTIFYMKAIDGQNNTQLGYNYVGLDEILQ